MDSYEDKLIKSIAELLVSLKSLGQKLGSDMYEKEEENIENSLANMYIKDLEIERKTRNG